MIKNKAILGWVTGMHVTVAAAMALAPGAAGAQSGNADETVEEVVVTGSRLVRRDFRAPSPIDRDAILDSG